ncbi:acyl-CoA dehydrogenase family protein [Streptomyces sp. NPDC057011]|uniref:acyl-CoA dehydrogenase family protein n=1 Tax=unclassified Streptomyces TaxID=2593676 RepID=UPI003630B135
MTAHAEAPPRPPAPAADRIRELDLLLGDADDPANPLGAAAVLAADERGELLAAGEEALAAFGLNAEFVPRALGGRFARADEFARLMRTVFRRDCALGIGYGVTSFIAGLPIWASGSPEQQRRAADLLLSGGRIVAAYTELAHGSDFSRIALTATADPAAPGGYRLTGGKQLVNNVSRAEAAVVFARTADRPGSRSHSHLLVGLDDTPRIDRSGRYPTSGVRGCLLGGISFDDHPVPAGALIGEEGAAMETVLRAFQVTRSVLPSMVVGVGDTQLRTVLGFARERRLYGRPVAELPHARATLTDAFLDLQVCDALATTVARSLHLMPEQTSVHSAAVKYLVPRLLQDSSYRLSVLLGARSYVREGPYALFQKMARDLPVVALAHAGSAVCQATILPQLPRLAARSWNAGELPPVALFDPAADLPALDFDRLELNSRGRDTLAAVLPAAARELAAAGDQPELARLAGLLADALADLAARVQALAPRDRTVLAGRQGFVLADRYAHLLAAAACLGLHRGPDPTWAIGTLHRLADRLGLNPGPLPAGTAARLHTELAARFESGAAFDLSPNTALIQGS